MVSTTTADAEQNGVLREAARWCLELSSGDIPSERIAHWQQWLAESEAHREAFDRIQSTWCAIDRCADGSVPWPTDAEVACDAYDGSVPVSAWRARPSRLSADRGNRRGSAAPDAPWRPRRWAVAGLAASVVAAAAPFVLSLSRSIQFAPPAVTIVETAPGENRDVPLGDGSVVSVGAQSVLWATLTRTSRELTLERGEAFFHVAKDPARPFIVKIGTTTVAAVGTAFNVRRAGERVVVAVAEGVVRVDARAATAPVTPPPGPQLAGIRTARLTVGQQLSIDVTDGSASMQIVDAAGIAAWRKGLLQYRDEPLQTVIADVSRYSERHIVIADPEIADLRVTSTVFAHDVEGWLQSLEAALPVRMVRAPDGTLRLESRPRG
jgi:transmembrane sensor